MRLRSSNVRFGYEQGQWAPGKCLDGALVVALRQETTVQFRYGGGGTVSPMNQADLDGRFAVLSLCRGHAYARRES